MLYRDLTVEAITRAYVESRKRNGCETPGMQRARETLQVLVGCALSWNKDTQTLGIPATA